MAALNNTPTGNAYSAAVGLRFYPPTGRVTVQVYNAAVYYILSLTEGETGGLIQGRPDDLFTGTDGQPTAERFLGPGFWVFDDKDFQGGRCVGVAFRSASIGVPAMVSASN